MPGPMQQQLQARPSLATVQTPSHPPPPDPLGSQQASQAHTNFPQMSNPGQFTAPQMKSLQGGPSRVPTPLQQPHLTNKSPASSPSSQLLSPRNSRGSPRTPVYMWPACFSSAEGRDSQREGGEWGRGEDRGAGKEGGREDSGPSGFPHRAAPWPLGPGLFPTQGAPTGRLLPWKHPPT